MMIRRISATHGGKAINHNDDHHHNDNYDDHHNDGYDVHLSDHVNQETLEPN